MPPTSSSPKTVNIAYIDESTEERFRLSDVLSPHYHYVSFPTFPLHYRIHIMKIDLLIVEPGPNTLYYEDMLTLTYATPIIIATRYEGHARLARVLGTRHFSAPYEQNKLLEEISRSLTLRKNF